MRLLVAATRFRVGRALGAQTFFHGVLSGLSVTGLFDSVTVAAGAETCAWIEDQGFKFPCVRVRSLPTVLGRYWAEQWEVPRVVRMVDPDVVFFPFNLMVKNTKPTVLMVHDAVGDFYAEHSSGFIREKYRLIQRSIIRGIRDADAIVVPTKAVKDEIIDRGYCSPDKVTVIPEATTNRRVLKSGVASSKENMIRVLVPGCHNYHKGAHVLLAAAGRLKVVAPHVYERVQVTITGVQARRRKAIVNEAAEHGIADSVVIHGRVSEAELARLYTEASVVVFPTLYEGFCLGILEALSIEKPVVASDLPVLREVSGGYARHFPAGDCAALVEALLRAVEDPVSPVPGRLWASRRCWSDYGKDLFTVAQGLDRCEKPGDGLKLGEPS